MRALPRGVLDSDVIFSRVLHELMGRAAADARLLDLVWSDELLEEAKNTLIEGKPLQPHVAEAWVGHMPREFPTGRADISQIPHGLDLSTLTADPDDQHVCALAIAGEADWLFTFDRGYLRSALAGHGVHVASPDVFLSEVVDDDPTPFIELVNAQLAVWGGGHRSLDDLLAAYERAKVPVFVGKLRHALTS